MIRSHNPSRRQVVRNGWYERRKQRDPKFLERRKLAARQYRLRLKLGLPQNVRSSLSHTGQETR